MPCKNWFHTVVALWLSLWLTATGMWAMVPFLTFFVEELGVTDPTARNSWTAILVAAAPLPAAFMGPIWGALGDRLGRKLMAMRGISAIVIFVGLMSFATSPWIMLVLRLMQGMFSGYAPPAMTLASLHAPEHARGRVTSIMQAAMPAGSVSGYALGGYLLENHGMRVVFPICSILAFIGLALVIFKVEDIPVSDESKSVSVKETLKRIPHNVADLFRTPLVPGLLTAVILMRGLGSCVDPHLARFLVDGLGTDKAFAGTFFSLQAVAFLVGTAIFGRLSDSWGPRKTFALCAACAAPLLLIQSYVEDRWVFAALRMLQAFCIGGAIPTAYTLTVQVTSPELRGQAMGTVFMGLVLGHGIGSAMGGELLNAFGFRTLFILLGVVFFSLALWMGGIAMLKPRRRQEVPGDDPYGKEAQESPPKEPQENAR